MFLFQKKTDTNGKQNAREYSPEIIAAREYLERTHPTLIGRDSAIAVICGNAPFKYIGCSQNGEYTRYHFCEGADERIQTAVKYSLLCQIMEKLIFRQFFKTKIWTN